MKRLELVEVDFDSTWVDFVSRDNPTRRSCFLAHGLLLFHILCSQPSGRIVTFLYC
jgi:hypothetical protein